MTTPTNATAERIGGQERAPAELLDVTQLAALLACSPRHCYRLSDCGKMPRPRKLGALVRWSRQEILNWIDGGCEPVRRRGGQR